MPPPFAPVAWRKCLTLSLDDASALSRAHITLAGLKPTGRHNADQSAYINRPRSPSGHVDPPRAWLFAEESVRPFSQRAHPIGLTDMRDMAFLLRSIAMAARGPFTMQAFLRRVPITFARTHRAAGHHTEQVQTP
jgi:hypothetical protein